MKFTWKETLQAFVELYEMDIRGELNRTPQGHDLANPIVRGFLTNRKLVDDLLSASGLNIECTDPISRNILRACVSALVLGEDAPLVVTRSIRISEKFSSTNSYKFLHAVLSKVIRLMAERSEA